MGTVYRVQAINALGDARVDELSSALSAEIEDIGLHRSVEVSVHPDALPGAPTLAVFFGSEVAACDPACHRAVEAALSDVITVLPVVQDLGRYSEFVPPGLLPINGLEWPDGTSARRVARRILEEFGIEERQRKAFISHKREDGLLAAEYLSDYLSHRGFAPFIDRFNIPAGVDLQARIADELESYAFLIVLETPRAHESDWVFDEVEYALTHLMGLHIVRWPGDFPEVPATARLPRQQLVSSDLTNVNGFDVLTPEALDRVLEEVEAAHAYSMVRRRRHLLRSVEDAAEVAGCTCTPLGDWRLLIEQGSHRDVVQVTGRLPEVHDLRELDGSRGFPAAHGGVLVHASRRIEPVRRGLLTWAVGGRPLTLVPENAIGGYW